MGAVTTVPASCNEPVLNYAPGSPERASLRARLAELGTQSLDKTAYQVEIDSAYAPQNLLRWPSTRSVEENLAPPTVHGNPHLEHE